MHSKLRISARQWAVLAIVTLTTPIAYAMTHASNVNEPGNLALLGLGLIGLGATRRLSRKKAQQQLQHT